MHPLHFIFDRFHFPEGLPETSKEKRERLKAQRRRALKDPSFERYAGRFSIEPKEPPIIPPGQKAKMRALGLRAEP